MHHSVVGYQHMDVDMHTMHHFLSKISNLWSGMFDVVWWCFCFTRLFTCLFIFSDSVFLNQFLHRLNDSWRLWSNSVKSTQAFFKCFKQVLIHRHFYSQFLKSSCKFKIFSRATTNWRTNINNQPWTTLNKVLTAAPFHEQKLRQECSENANFDFEELPRRLSDMTSITKAATQRARRDLARWSH